MKPSEDCGHFDATTADPTTGIIYYDVVDENDIDEAGTWTIWPYVTFSDNRSAPGPSSEMEVTAEPCLELIAFRALKLEREAQTQVQDCQKEHVVRVSDRNGSPLSGIQVWAATEKSNIILDSGGRTDKNGKFAFHFDVPNTENVVFFKKINNKVSRLSS